MTDPSSLAGPEEVRQPRSHNVTGSASGGVSAPGQLVLIGFTWLVTRLAIAHNLAWFSRRTSYEDVALYHTWATEMVHQHHLPAGTSWQYPVGAALLFLLAEIGPAHYDRTFCLLMLACDLSITVTLATIACRERRFHGVWAWLLTTTAFGPIILLRFDLAPTLALVLGLAVLWSGKRLGRFGAVVGVGLLLKVWPLLALLAARTWRELLRAGLCCVATVVLVTAAASIYFGNTLSFLSNQVGRGLEVDSVAASPWFLVNAFSRAPLRFRFQSGATDLWSTTADSFASALRVLMVLAALLVGGCWVRQVRAGRVARPATARDAVLTVVLWYLVISPVLSPQYFIWVIGLGSVILCSRETEMHRPLILLAVTLALTRVVMQNGLQIYLTSPSGALTPTTITSLALVARNLVLLLAALDAGRVTLAHRR